MPDTTPAQPETEIAPFSESEKALLKKLSIDPDSSPADFHQMRERSSNPELKAMGREEYLNFLVTTMYSHQKVIDEIAETDIISVMTVDDEDGPTTGYF